MISTFPFPAWVTVGRLMGDHLWQSTLFAVVVGCLTLAFRNNRAEVRNRLWLAASVKFLIPFAALAAIGSHFSWRQAAPLAQNPAPFVINMDTMSQPFSRLAAGTPSAVVSHSMASVVPILLFAIWLCGCAAILLTWLTCWRRVAVSVREASPVQQGPELDALRSLEVIVGITRPVTLVSSSTSLEPGVFGIVNPVLLWPRSIAERLTSTHAEMILAHELSHVRRRDNLAAAIHMVVETIFWFHPLVWWLGARMVDERERACDEDVLRLGSKPQVYAESVLKVCEFYLESPIVCVAGITGSNLKRRMERIMSNHVGEALNGRRKLLLAAAGVAALAVPLAVGVLTAPRLQAQAPAAQSLEAMEAAGVKMAFDVASVKPNNSGGRFASNIGPLYPGAPYTPTGGFFSATNVKLADLILFAYDLDSAQTINLFDHLPKWGTTDRFDVQAKSEANPSREQMRLMMQSLLADRFKLAVHRETKEGPIYALVLVKPGQLGPQLKPDAEPCPTNPASASATSSADVAGEFPPICGAVRMPPTTPGRMRIGGRSETMKTFAMNLDRADRPVVDRTGLVGGFDLNMEYQPDDPQSPGANSQLDKEGEGPAFLEALREQLGLKLEPQTGPVTVLVVDHVEEPSPN